MSRRSWAVVTVLAYVGAVLAWLLAGPHAAKMPAADDGKNKPSAKEADGPDVFGLTKVWSFHLDFAAKEWDAMQPTGGMRFPGMPGGPGGPGAPPKPPEKPAADPGEPPRETHKSAFGMDFPIARGEFTAEGTTLKNVGFRYKGNGSYMPSMGKLKRNLKVEFDHFDDAQRFHGQKTLNLNAGAADPTRMHEALAFAVYREAGVPAPRTAFAEVTLTVPGKYDKEYLGLYTVVEQVDKTFLKEHFKNNKGLLMKPERMRGIDYLGEDWEKYKGPYQPKHDPTKEEAQRVIAFARLLNKADDDQFKKEIGSYLDVDEFLRFLAVTALLSNMDSFLTIGHNYYLYLNPETKRFTFIPWDLDLSFAGFPMMGSAEQQMDLSLTHPHSGGHKLIDRLLAMKDVSERYQQLLKELAATGFSKERLLKNVEVIEKTTKEPLAREAAAAAARKEGAGGFGFGPPGGMFGRSPDLRTFVEKRTESVEAQLAGKSKGYVPAMGFGPPGGPGGPPGGFGLGNAVARPLLDALDADKDGKLSRDELVAGVKTFFKDCDKDNKGSLDEKAVAEALNRLLPPPAGFGPPPGGLAGPGGRPGGFGPGTFLAGPVVKRADADKDNKVTLDELVAAAEALFKEADKEKKGKLEEKDVAAAINGLFPPPPAFGPGGPGGRPGDGLAKPLLEALDADKDGKVTYDELAAGVRKFFTDCDKDKKGKLEEQAIAEGLNGLFPPPGFGPPPGGPGAFGPGTFLAGSVVKRADADKDGKVTLDELVTAAEALFKECDKDRNGSLDEKEVGAGINLFFPAPPGFGPPGGRPEEPKKEEKR